MKALIVAMLIAAAATGPAGAERGLPPLVIPDCLGVNIHFTSGQEEQVRKIAAAGLRFIRMDLFWHTIEREKGRYDFSDYDELVQDLAKHGIRPLFILDYGNAFYDSGLAPHTDEGRRAFAAFAAAAAERFKDRGVLWEIWNEPNLPKFWQPDANVENYIKLVEVTARALREADPDCTILAPALSGWDFAWLERAFELGLLKHIDAVSLHAYGSSKPEDAARYYSTVKSLIAKYAPDAKPVPILSGEWGYSAVGGFTLERQAEYVVRSYLVNIMNDARLSIWYDWRDDGPDRNEVEHNFGIVFEDLTEKPAYAAVRTLTRVLDGFSFASRITMESDDDYLALFSRGSECRLAAWTTREPHDVTIPLDVPRVELVSLLGERREAEVTDGKLTLRLTGAVTYVIPLSSSRRLLLESELNASAAVSRDDGRMAVKVNLRVPHTHASGYVARASAPGMEASSVRLDTGTAEEGFVNAQITGRYVYDGRPGPKVTITLEKEGEPHPFVRIVELDTASCPSVQILPPSALDLLVAVNRPSKWPGRYEGILEIGNADGLSLKESSCRFVIEPDEKRTVVRFPMHRAPAGTFSFAVRIVEPDGSETLRAPAGRFSLVETFSDGKPGEQVDKYRVELDGDDSVPASAKLTYSDAPPGGPDGVCAKLDYSFAEGWRFVRVSPRPAVPIEGKPRSAIMWVCGDGKHATARLRVADSQQQAFQPDYGRLSFMGWRVLEAPLTGELAGHWGGPDDGIMRYPISWDTIFLLDSPGGRRIEGTVYLGPLMLCYD